MEEVSVAASIVSLAIGLLAIWLSIIFYRMSSDASRKVDTSAKAIESSVIRLEKLFDRLYADTFSMMRDTVTDMRRHIWPEPNDDPDSSPGEDEETQRRADEKLQELQDQVTKEIAALAQETGLTGARVAGLQQEIMPLLEKTLDRSRQIEAEAREESLRQSVVRVLRAARGKHEVTADDILDSLQRRFDLRTVIDEIERMRDDRILDFEGPLGPFTVITYIPPARRGRKEDSSRS